jgi:hypothetical protein
MQPLAWLLIPVVAGSLATLYVVWISRPRKPDDANKGMQGLYEFRAAMERQIPLRTSSKNDEKR